MSLKVLELYLVVATGLLGWTLLAVALRWKVRRDLCAAKRRLRAHLARFGVADFHMLWLSKTGLYGLVFVTWANGATLLLTLREFEALCRGEGGEHAETESQL